MKEPESGEAEKRFEGMTSKEIREAMASQWNDDGGKSNFIDALKGVTDVEGLLNLATDRTAGIHGAEHIVYSAATNRISEEAGAKTGSAPGTSEMFSALDRFPKHMLSALSSILDGTSTAKGDTLIDRVINAMTGEDMADKENGNYTEGYPEFKVWMKAFLENNKINLADSLEDQKFALSDLKDELSKAIRQADPK